MRNQLKATANESRGPIIQSSIFKFHAKRWKDWRSESQWPTLGPKNHGVFGHVRFHWWALNQKGMELRQTMFVSSSFLWRIQESTSFEFIFGNSCYTVALVCWSCLVSGPTYHPKPYYIVKICLFSLETKLYIASEHSLTRVTSMIFPTAL